MTEDYFWGISLSGASKEHKWEPDALKENGGGPDISLSAKGEHTLIIKQALLGSDAKEGEVNTIEVETTGFKGTIKLPIVTLIAGKTNQVLLDLNLPDPPVTLKLIEGSGPIHLAGNHVISTEEYNEDDDDEEDDFDEQAGEEDEEEEDEPAVKIIEEKQSKKRTNSNTGQNQPKKKKKEAKDD